MSKRSDKFLVEDILEASEKITRYLKGYTEKKFLHDEIIEDAVVRNFSIIGEAATKISTPFKKKHPEVPWRTLKGFRNRIVHDYIGVDYSVIWNIYKNNLTDLIKQFQKILSE